MPSTLVFLTPAGAVLAIGVLLPLTALYFIHRRARRVRGSLGLSTLAARHLLMAIGAVVAAGCFLGVAAAQPVLERTTTLRTRTDAEVFIVVDISRSMLGRRDTRSPMRIERAKVFASALRASLPDVPVGIASLTDRTLPHLFPGVDEDVFEATLDRAVGIERPPPRSSLVTSATKLDALATIRTQRYFSPKSRKRLVVVLTDGESQPVSAARLADVFHQPPGIETVFVQFWGPDERVFAGNAAEPLYRPDPSARAFLERLARTIGGTVFGEDALFEARKHVRRRLGSGPTVVRGEQGGRVALAPYAAAAALAPLLLVLWRRDR
jgi:von Willebrand factor type A domain